MNTLAHTLALYWRHRWNVLGFLVGAALAGYGVSLEWPDVIGVFNAAGIGVCLTLVVIFPFHFEAQQKAYLWDLYSTDPTRFREEVVQKALDTIIAEMIRDGKLQSGTKVDIARDGRC